MPSLMPTLVRFCIFYCEEAFLIKLCSYPYEPHFISYFLQGAITRAIGIAYASTLGIFFFITTTY